MKKPNPKILIALVLMMAGVLAMAYPFYSFLWGDHVEKAAMEAYTKKALDLSATAKRKIREASENYEKSVDKNGGSVVDPWAVEDYEGSLNLPFEKEQFGYVIIPAIDVKGPLYLGATRSHLNKGLAQVEGTSLPIGGIDRRAVIAGHRGGHRVSVKLLHADQLKEGDKVYLYTMGNRLEYQVTGREVILPGENEKLLPIPGKDMITLLTCHPYPVNNKRLLINCERVPEKKPVKPTFHQMEEDLAAEPVTPKVAKSHKLTIAAAVGLTIVLLLLLLRFIKEFI